MPTPRILSREAVAFNQALGASIRDQRRKVWISNRNLADELGMDYNGIHAIEAGLVAPTVFQLNRICEMLHVGVDEILDGANESINGLVRVS